MEHFRDLVRRFGTITRRIEGEAVAPAENAREKPDRGARFSSTLAAKLAELRDSCQRFIRCRAVPSGAKVCDLFRVQEEASPGIVPLLCPFAPDFA